MTQQAPDPAATAQEEPWRQPPELLPYERHTLYPGRAEELMNHPATVFNNAVVAIMRAETAAEYRLLERLRAVGALREDFV